MMNFDLNKPKKSYVYIAVTGNTPMTEGHCLLTPKEHFPNLPSCDETVAREMLNIRRLFGFYNKTYSIKSNFTLTLSRFENLKDATLIISIIFAKDRNYEFS